MNILVKTDESVNFTNLQELAVKMAINAYGAKLPMKYRPEGGDPIFYHGANGIEPWELAEITETPENELKFIDFFANYTYSVDLKATGVFIPAPVFRSTHINIIETKTGNPLRLPTATNHGTIENYVHQIGRVIHIHNNTKTIKTVSINSVNCGIPSGGTFAFVSDATEWKW